MSTAPRTAPSCAAWGSTTPPLRDRSSASSRRPATRPVGLYIFGGATLTGSLHGKPVSVLNTYEAAGAVMTGAMAAEELDALERAAVLTFGACPGQFTANTMGMVSEILGLAPLGSSIIPAGVRGARAALARSAGQLVMRLLKEIPRSGADCSAPC